MNPNVRGALRQVAARLQERGIPFALGGSGLLWALGLTDAVGDIDVMVAAAHEEALLRATADWRVSHSREGTELWASAWFCQLEVHGVPVDVIGGMAFRHARGIARVPARAGGTVDLDGIAVPYADPALWWAIYRAYKPEKAVLLEQIVPPGRRAAVAAELDLDA